MYPPTIRRISRDDIGHNTFIERYSDISGTTYASIVKDGVEVAICRSEDEGEMVKWWKKEGWKVWRDRRKKSGTDYEPSTDCRFTAKRKLR